MVNLRQTSETPQQQWQAEAFDSFLNMVKAADGDFPAIDRLGKALYEPESFDLMINFLCGHQQGKQAFEKGLRLGTIDLPKLHQLPKETFGYQYADHLIRNGLTPLQAKSIENRHQYLIAHLTETHDIWHVVTGSNTDIFGEMKLEAFYVAQLYASRFWLGLLTKNLLKAVVYDVELSSRYLDAITEGWIMARKAEPLFGIEWDQLWEIPLVQIRKDLQIDVVQNYK
ncbi:MAG: Coq4 family protein [Cyanobacteria bacterium P01_G01_bin.49]